MSLLLLTSGILVLLWGVVLEGVDCSLVVFEIHIWIMARQIRIMLVHA
jgi:hypothetical protein